MTDDTPNAKIAWDCDPAKFDDETPIKLTIKLEMSAGLWNWVKAKADYEGLSHGEEVKALIEQERLNAIRHAEEHGEK